MLNRKLKKTSTSRANVLDVSSVMMYGLRLIGWKRNQKCCLDKNMEKTGCLDNKQRQNLKKDLIVISADEEEDHKHERYLAYNTNYKHGDPCQTNPGNNNQPANDERNTSRNKTSDAGSSFQNKKDDISARSPDYAGRSPLKPRDDAGTLKRQMNHGKRL